jgi:predicted ester cyclase
MGDDRRAVERYWQAFNDRDLSLLDDVIAENYVNEAALPGTPPGAAGQAQVMERLWSAFPDARFEIEHLAQDGDTVVCVGTMSGTHEGELFGIAGSGRPIAWRQVHIITVADGRATAHRAIRDDLGLMRQMGAMPGR